MIDLKVGDVLEGNSITVTEYHLLGFAGITGDYNRLHVDELFARTTLFNGRIAHGLLLLSLGVGLVFYFIDGYFLYGFDKVRFLEPVRLGDTVSSKLIVNNIVEREKYSLYHCELQVINNRTTEAVVATIILGREKIK
ncbi:MAG: MaoC family dehydratase [Candidatus Parvarchaeota archaeon]